MKPLYRLTWVVTRLVVYSYFRGRYHNAERVPSDGPAILASNHCSYLDPPLIGGGLDRDLNYLARDTLFRFPLFAWALRNVNVVPVDRDGAGASGLRTILDRLLTGNAIILFPEGTRTSDGNLQPARSGIGLTVIKSTAPVVPVRVFGTFEAWNRFTTLPRPHRVQVKYGRPLGFEALRTEAQSCSKNRLKAIYQETAETIVDAIANLRPFTELDKFPRH